MKKITFIIISLTLIIGLTGCNKEIKNSSNNTPNKKQEIIFAEEIINTPETPCGEEDCSIETENYSLPNIEDYFEDNFFDLESYLIDCGAECIGASDSGYIASFKNWDIIIYSRTYNNNFQKLAIENNIEQIEYYYIPPSEAEMKFFHEVNNGIEICDSSIYKLPDTIYGLYENNWKPENPHIYGFVYD